MSNLRKSLEINKRNIKEKLSKKNIDFKKVIQSYSEGMDERHIAVLYKLEQEELSYILNQYVTEKIMNKRIEARKKLNLLCSSNMMGLPKEKQKEDEKILSIKEALALFEEER